MQARNKFQNRQKTNLKKGKLYSLQPWQIEKWPLTVHSSKNAKNFVLSEDIKQSFLLYHDIRVKPIMRK